MSLLSPRLRRIDGALAALAEDHGQAMLLTTLNGYLTGILLSPEAIGPEEWLPPIWDGEAGTPPFPDERDAKWFADLVTDHSRAIAAAIAKGGRYKPLLEVDHAPRRDLVGALDRRLCRRGRTASGQLGAGIG